ncbi:MAG: hypothetical protein JSS69_09685 [Acidobacteria bacterium]|nr:hypothetical protein [Acidobacteriota bacterium]MBS1866172.1 hypothetical protein [Acidobacteriota bacterium]
MFSLVLLAATHPANAQSTGPLAPPPATGPAPSAPVAAKAKPIARRAAEAPITSEPPAMPPDQIIQKFAEKEVELKKVLGSYTWTQYFLLQTLDSDNVPDGEYEMQSDILFTPEGKRFEKVTYAPANTLKRIVMSQQDLDDLKKIQPFAFTGDELGKYNITYVGRQKVDDLSTYVFDVEPKVIEKKQRYFKGRLWVDDHDLQIVKTYGKAVPDIVTKREENLFPRFTTYRENLFGDLWFPTYTHFDDILRFREGPVHLVSTVKYTNYKRFGSTFKIGTATEAPPQ